MSAISEQIKPVTLEVIVRQAENLGLSADEYLRNLLPETGEDDLALKADEDEFEADMIAFAEETADDLQIYNGTYSREDIYFDHD